jgi:hypothetical protein
MLYTQKKAKANIQLNTCPGKVYGMSGLNQGVSTCHLHAEAAL